MRCSVTAGKHINSTRAIARQLLGKRVPVATDTHAMVEVLWTIIMDMMFSMWFGPKYYKQSQSNSGD
jgi:hypothetical protein